MLNKQRSFSVVVMFTTLSSEISSLSSALHIFALVRIRLMIINVELLEVFPNNTVQMAMHKQLSSERVRRAAIVTAHGFREQVKTIGAYT